MIGDRLVRHPITWGGEEVVLLRPARPFTVDGITYRVRDRDTSVECIRPMIELLADDDPYDDDDERSRMFHSDPPTEEELDLYVKHRILPAT